MFYYCYICTYYRIKIFFMKKNLISILLFFSIFTLYAQRERNYIYLLDCTKSMIGFNGSIDIWDTTKDYLESDLRRLSDDCSYAIIPFQDKVLNTFAGNGPDAVTHWIKDIEPKCNEWVQNVTRTNICDAWLAGLNQCDPNKYNYIYLLTDGTHNMPAPNNNLKLLELLSNFCNKNKNTHAYYVMLTDKANDARIIEILENCPNLHIVNPSNGPVKPFGHIEPNNIHINTLELDKEKVLGFALNGIFDASIECSDPYFNVTLVDNHIKDNSIKLRFGIKEQIPESIPNYDFAISIKSPNVNIVNNPITVNVTNQPERIISINLEDGQDLGNAVYTESFLFFDEKPSDTLHIDLNTSFNQTAIEYNSQATLKLTSGNGSQNDFSIFFNGEKIKNGSFTLTKDSNVLSILFKKEAETGKHYFYLECERFNNLERINDSFPEDFKLQLKANYDTNWHWLKTLLMWIGIILLALLFIWFIFVRPMISRFKIGSVLITEPYFANKRIHKARKIIFTNKQRKDNIFAKIFLGTTIYEINPIWTDEWEIRPSRNSGMAITQGKYTINPYASTLQIGQDYFVKNNTTNQTIKIKII